MSTPIQLPTRNGMESRAERTSAWYAVTCASLKVVPERRAIAPSRSAPVSAIETVFMVRDDDIRRPSAPG